jgi:uncharacterized surface protein with fasciclin (FAS1) repeats
MDDAKMHTGKVMLKTVQGESLTVMLHDDVMQSNGVIHVIDTVLMPS